MAKKKKKEPAKMPEALPAPKAVKRCKYEDPCFHCQHMAMNSTAMDCEKKSPAFWATFQGFHENAENDGFKGDVCEHFKELKK